MSSARPIETISPMEIVKKHRLAYRNAFMLQTLFPCDGVLQVPAYWKDEDDEVYGFENCSIRVHYDAPDHPQILASNQFTILDDATLAMRGLISVSAKVMRESIVQRKAILAHDWIELMVKFAIARQSDGKSESEWNPRDTARLAFVMRNEPAAPFEDTADTRSATTQALRELLISSHSLEEIAGILGTTLDEIRTLRMNEDPQGLALSREVVDYATGNLHVDRRLVEARLRECIFQPAASSRFPVSRH